jgi:hypothetical protein
MSSLNQILSQIPPADYFELLGLFNEVFQPLADQIARAEEARKYLFEAQALPDSFPAEHLEAVNSYKTELDSKTEGIKSLLHDLYKHFQSELSGVPVNLNNNGNTNNESLGPPPRRAAGAAAGAAAYNNNNNNYNDYDTNNNMNMRMHLPPGLGLPRRARARKTKGGKRRRNAKRRTTHRAQKS